MPDPLLGIVEKYFTAVRDVHGLGAGTPELSYYPAQVNLLNDVGKELKPKVFCLSILENTGAGHPDFGLFAANQIQRGEPQRGQMPERGVIESKKIRDDAWLTAASDQVSDYFEAYRLVIVTNFWDFLILGEGPDGHATKLESYRVDGHARQKVMRLATDEFIRRFLIYVLPTGFHRIRHYGLFASGVRANNIAHARELLAAPIPREQDKRPNDGDQLEQPVLAHPCPRCGGRMIVIETFERGRAPRASSPGEIRIDTS